MAIDVDSSEEVSLDSDIYVSGVQKFFTYAGHYAYEPARTVFRNLERLSHTMPPEEAYQGELRKRVQGVATAIILLPFAAALLIPAVACLTVAAAAGKGRFELIGPSSPASPWEGRSVEVVSINACFQDPWSTFSGIKTPFEQVAPSMTRVAALVDAVAGPTILMGQEFESISAQDEAIRLLRVKGYQYFLRDLGSHDPFKNSSGLFVASKVPLENIGFIPYPQEDRSGWMAKMSERGTLTFTVKVGGRDLRLINVHLNYAEGAENQAARNRQLTKYVVPLLRKGPAAVLGDLNFDTSAVPRQDSGLEGYTNAFEGIVTCTDEGKHTLRGKEGPCGDCAEKIDGLIYDEELLKVENTQVCFLGKGRDCISDHAAISATLSFV